MFKMIDWFLYWLEWLTGYALDFGPLRLVKVECES